MRIEAVAETRRHLPRSKTPRSLSRMRAVHVIDGVLDPLELLHLADRGLDPVRVQGLVARLSAELGRPAPQFVVAARDSKKLHSALLDWQAVLQGEENDV